MASKIQSDFSKWPECIRESFPYVVGEVCELRQAWVVYHDLFMNDRDTTEMLSSRLGGLLGVFQNLLQDEMFLATSRLTDRDSGSNTNLTVWCLLPGAAHAKDPVFVDTAKAALDAIAKAARDIRRHRNKRIAHFDLDVSLEQATLPTVTMSKIKEAIVLIEDYLNLYYFEFKETTMLFDTLGSHDIIGRAMKTARKAETYDELEAENVVEPREWRRRELKKRIQPET